MICRKNVYGGALSTRCRFNRFQRHLGGALLTAATVDVPRWQTRWKGSVYLSLDRSNLLFDGAFSAFGALSKDAKSFLGFPIIQISTLF